MQKLIFALLLLAAGHSFCQDCKSSLLFKEGARLEYRNYMAHLGGFGKAGFSEITRLVYEINSVKDSAGNSISVITKTGYGANENIFYRKQIIAICDQKKIFLDCTHYGVDTTFLISKNPTGKDEQVFITAEATGDKYAFPVNIQNDSRLENIQTTGVITNYMNGPVGPVEGSGGMGQSRPSSKPYLITNRNNPPNRYVPKYKVKTTFKDLKVAGKEEVHTVAGTFMCYKITGKTDVTMENVPGIPGGATVYYYNPEVGIVKIESFIRGEMMGYTELVNIKK